MIDLFFTAVAVGWIFALLWYLARLPGPHCKMEEDEEEKDDQPIFK